MKPKRKPAIGRRGLARLAYSLATAQLADQARSQVSTDSDAWCKSGDFVDAARGLVIAAQVVLERAVILERQRGMSWAELGEVLQISKQAAQQKYGEVVDDWKLSLDRVIVPNASGFSATCIPGEGGEAPDEHARRLDEWALVYGNKTRGKKSPVSDGLEEVTLTEQMSELGRLATRVAKEADPSALRAFHEAKVAVFTRAAEEDPRDMAAADAAWAARAQLAALTESASAASKSKRDVN